MPQFSAWAGWSTRTTERRIRLGQIRSVKSGRLVRIPITELERILAAAR